MEEITHAECGQCGWLGPLADLKDHPTRPMPTDIGFCPDCSAEIEYELTAQEAKEILDGYV